MFLGRDSEPFQKSISLLDHRFHSVTYQIPITKVLEAVLLISLLEDIYLSMISLISFWLFSETGFDVILSYVVEVEKGALVLIVGWSRLQEEKNSIL